MYWIWFLQKAVHNCLAKIRCWSFVIKLIIAALTTIRPSARNFIRPQFPILHFIQSSRLKLYTLFSLPDSSFTLYSVYQTPFYSVFQTPTLHFIQSSRLKLYNLFSLPDSSFTLYSVFQTLTLHFIQSSRIQIYTLFSLPDSSFTLYSVFQTPALHSIQSSIL